MDHSKNIKIYGIGGDTIHVPEHTETAFWSCLGNGGDGIITGVRCSKDGVLLCTRYDSLEKVSENSDAISAMDWKTIQTIDIGKKFTSTDINPDDHSITKGKDFPWEGNQPGKRALKVPSLKETLILFGRRCDVGILLPEHQEELYDKSIELLFELGLESRVKLYGSLKVCRYLKQHYPIVDCALLANDQDTPEQQLEEASAISIHTVVFESEIITNDRTIPSAIEVYATKYNIDLSIYSKTNLLGVNHQLKKLSGNATVTSIITDDILGTVESITPPAKVFSDNFKGHYINRQKWSAGYSHANQGTTIYQDNGLHISIQEGGEYSGAAAIYNLPIHNRFDACVDFHVTNPTQGTTFEMAAISIDPGYFRIDNSNLNSRSVNLTFDVHGAPPYASSERDEADGFRSGWNNGFNLAKFDANWNADSVNMFNKYGRDVGNGKPDNPNGTLRLIRNGSVFVSYYKDKYNKGWVCSGVMLVPNLSDNIYLRLAAKHWAKGGKPCPGNHVTFSNFKLFQF